MPDFVLDEFSTEKSFVCRSEDASEEFVGWKTFNYARDRMKDCPTKTTSILLYFEASYQFIFVRKFIMDWLAGNLWGLKATNASTFLYLIKPDTRPDALPRTQSVLVLLHVECLRLCTLSGASR